MIPHSQSSSSRLPEVLFPRVPACRTARGQTPVPKPAVLPVCLLSPGTGHVDSAAGPRNGREPGSRAAEPANGTSESTTVPRGRTCWFTPRDSASSSGQHIAQDGGTCDL